MARPSPLSDKQWEEIGVRFLAGEVIRSLAREFGVSDTAIRKRFSLQTKRIKEVANQIVETEKNLKSLPMSSQISARNLANELMAISTHLASAGKLGAMTSHELHNIANRQVHKIDKDDPLQSADILQGISALTKMANESSSIGLSLINSNKEMLKDLGDKEKPEEKDITPASADEAREVYELITRRRNA